MQIYGPAAVHGPQPVNAPHTAKATSGKTTSSPQAADELQLSDAAQLAAKIDEIPDIRAERVAEIRAAIADGTYDNEARLSGALDSLLDEIG